MGERLTVEEFHDEVIGVLVPSDVVDRADVRMRERGDGLGFAFEPRAELGIRGEFRGKDLDGDGAVEPCIPRPVHLAHAAGARLVPIS